MQSFMKNNFFEEKKVYVKFSIRKCFIKVAHIVCMFVNRRELSLILMKYFLVELRGEKTQVGTHVIFHSCWMFCMCAVIAHISVRYLVSFRVDEFLLPYHQNYSMKQIFISLEPVTDNQQDFQYFVKKCTTLATSK